MNELTLFQTVHVAHGKARLVREHIALLDEAAREWFGYGYAPDPKVLAQQIVEITRSAGYPTSVSSFVRITLHENSDETLSPAGLSLYDGYAFRSLLPEGRIFPYELPFLSAPSSMREAVAQAGRVAAHKTEDRIAVRCNASDELEAADESPLFAVIGKEIRYLPRFRFAEENLIRQSLTNAGLKLVETPFGRTDLPRIDELFYVDHRGITALSRCDGQPLMSIFAERIATAMEATFQKM